MMNSTKKIALVAHDFKKKEMLEWTKKHEEELAKHMLYATGTTGRIIMEKTALKVTPLLSGPLGGDQQIGAKIAEGEIDFLFFFWDPLESQPHDPDVKALLRLASVWNIPVACNVSTADFLISSPYMNSPYERKINYHKEYQNREIK